LTDIVHSQGVLDCYLYGPSNAVATITSLGTLFSTASEAGKLCIAPMGSGNYSFLNNTGGIRYLCVTYQGRK
jgi:hypothetical protein